MPRGVLTPSESLPSSRFLVMHDVESHPGLGLGLRIITQFSLIIWICTGVIVVLSRTLLNRLVSKLEVSRRNALEGEPYERR